MSKIPYGGLIMLGAIAGGGYLLYKSGILQTLGSVAETIGGIQQGIQHPAETIRTWAGTDSIHDRWNLLEQDEQKRRGDRFKAGIGHIVKLQKRKRLQQRNVRKILLWGKLPGRREARLMTKKKEELYKKFQLLQKRMI